MKKYLAVLRYLLSIHLAGLLMLSIFRIILFLSNLGQVADVSNKGGLLAQSMLKGVQFDNLIACYVIALPLIILMILALFNKISKISIRIFNIYFITFYTLIFALSAADIPYFQYYQSHMGGAIFNWLGFGFTTLGMMFQEPSYYLYIAIFIIIIILFSRIVSRISNKLLGCKTSNLNKKELVYYIPLSLVVFGLCFFGIRGTTSNYPLRVSNAYFSNNSFFNQLGLNPAFFFIKSSSNYFKKRSNLDGIMGDEEALKLAQNFLNILPENTDRPLEREVINEGEPIEANIVVVLMESMSSDYLTMTYKDQYLTPYINQLIEESYYFPNFYSSGIHTNNGIGCTLFGYPPQFDRPMLSVDVHHYMGMPYTLQKEGYQTYFFTTSNPQYDHMNSFLLENGIDRIYSQEDYPEEEIVNTFGVPDQYLFEYGLEKLDEKAKLDKPFFATFLTVSNHPPLVVPAEFKGRGDTEHEDIVAYADHSIEVFMEGAKKKDWYKNTIFVFLGDHGRALGRQPYNMALNYNHIPLIIHSPLLTDMPKQFTQFGGQIDVFPTLMGMLNMSYTNNTLGIDLFKEERPFTYFVSDDKLGCINDEFVYIYTPEGKTSGLYRYRNKEEENLASQYPALLDSMKTYSTSMIITSEYMVKNRLTAPVRND